MRTGEDCTMVQGSGFQVQGSDPSGPLNFPNHVTDLSARGEARLRRGHPWIYRADLGDVHATGGDRVVVRNGRGRTLGHAFYSDRSQIALRMLTRGDDAPADDALIRRRIEAALAFRGTLAIDASAYRLVHGEADLLPSLIVDRYGDYLVVQTLSQGADRLLPLVVSTLQELAESARDPGAERPADPGARRPRTEGRSARRARSRRRLPSPRTACTTTSTCGAARRPDSSWTSGRIGARRRSMRRGRLLDCFTYHGGFALALAARCEHDDGD